MIGGGLAGCEAAWQIARAGLPVTLREMRPKVCTDAHISDRLAELVCSNSLGSNLPDRASGLLKNELRFLESFLIDCAEKTAVNAGGALAVDRIAFAELATARLAAHPLITVVREEATAIPRGPAVIASGPLTSPALSRVIQKLTGENHLYFYDAIAPVIAADSINFDHAFHCSRYGRGNAVEGDYVNCPFSKEEYDLFVDALLTAERIQLKSFEMDIENGVKSGLHNYFESCLPIEILASRGHKTLAFGPMRPIGIIDPRSGRRPYAVLQLRRENAAGDLFNMVGFQTNLKYGEQKRVFRMIPGLEHARFERLGEMHRNTFLNAPLCLRPSLQYKFRDDLFFAGQLTGIEGYCGNIASGLIAGLGIAALQKGRFAFIPPPTTMIGALLRYITTAEYLTFQPMKANFGIMSTLPLPTGRRGKRERARLYAERALCDLRVPTIGQTTLEIVQAPNKTGF